MEGYRVIGVDLESSRGRLAEAMGRIEGVAVCEDIASPSAASRLRARIETEVPTKQLDVLVHCAGITRDKSLKRMAPDAFRSVVDVNLEAVLRINRAFGLEDEGVPALRPGGRVVLLSSINGIGGAYGQTNYALSKSGLIGYAHALAPRLFARGITVNCVAPGFIETEMTAAIPWLMREVGRRANALKQGGLPEDVAAAVAFFACQQAFAVTGQTLRVCGGNLVGR
jgi:3-oxoacyl-[acyl-carrier protein] reductase